MITRQELNKHNYPTSEEMDSNLDILCDRLNKLQQACGLVFVITSGLRSEQQQYDLITQGKSNAVHSKHIIGAAADIYDLSGDINKWCLANIERLEGIGLWCENKQGPWQHTDIAPRIRTSLVYTMSVVCIVYFTLSGFSVNYNLQGKLIEQRGDNWLIDFSSGLKNKQELKTEQQVILVNSNACLKENK